MSTVFSVISCISLPPLTADELSGMDEAFATNVTPLECHCGPPGFVTLPPVSLGGRGFQSVDPSIARLYLEGRDRQPEQLRPREYPVQPALLVATTVDLTLPELCRRLCQEFPTQGLSWSTLLALHLYVAMPQATQRAFFIPASQPPALGALVCHSAQEVHLTTLHLDPARVMTKKTFICQAGFELYLPAPPLC
ncbi:MAG: hypothetical protein CEO22_300 [Candidatus Berkelbacteria bacterium Gr01-1014_85]|uniref:Uncharacterized protein n=1 Tax=Candidatus Berkelbacteria bacterium Gr01-1014_85 TaxID=2017150 RepID=A0A554JC14_9BACT|nr:MAG: hypothetical protein CEO22_300 [Candidatus Berkelbacteria bacterium Gr01-1014_85]